MRPPLKTGENRQIIRIVRRRQGSFNEAPAEDGGKRGIRPII